MGRPPEFDREEALAKAIRVFARHGYETASTTDLIQGMGIGRQSLYGAFGDKRRLFLEALRRYSAASFEEMREALAGPGPASAVLEEALLVGLGSADDLESGCLGVGSIIEFSRSDPDINRLNDDAGRAVTAAFSARIAEGVAAGELRPGLDGDAAARLLLTLRSGLKVAARAGANEAELRETARLGLRWLAAAST
ncbi:MAG: TetR/AcrR family transcriptional regulator [Caulobacter sp.]|nr:TetR/AcrR family transcriptional regulator [Caulobacter sp.]